MKFKKEQKQFEEKYEKQIIDILALTGESVGGAGMVCKGLWEPSANILAYVDIKTGELKEGNGRISWIVKEEEKEGWLYRLEPLKIYHFQVCKIKTESVAQNCPEWLLNSFRLVNVVQRDLTHPELERILEAYCTPITFLDELCGVSFSLERRFSWFHADIDWMGQDCSVALDCDEEDGETAAKALDVFHVLYSDMEKWDKEFRRFAASELTGNANDWLMDSSDEENGEPEEITEGSFAERIWISELTVSPDGAYEAYYQDDDMFWGHIIIVSGNIRAGIDSAYIAG